MLAYVSALYRKNYGYKLRVLPYCSTKSLICSQKNPLSCDAKSSNFLSRSDHRDVVARQWRKRHISVMGLHWYPLWPAFRANPGVEVIFWCRCVEIWSLQDKGSRRKSWPWTCKSIRAGVVSSGPRCFPLQSLFCALLSAQSRLIDRVIWPHRYAAFTLGAIYGT